MHASKKGHAYFLQLSSRRSLMRHYARERVLDACLVRREVLLFSLSFFS